jgi:hypothetical protein
MINWKRPGMKRHGGVQAFTWRNRGKLSNTSVKIPNVSAKIRSEHLPSVLVPEPPCVSHTLFCKLRTSFISHTKVLGGTDSSVGIRAGSRSGVRFQTGARDFSVLHSAQTGPAAHPASSLMGTVVSFPGGKAAGA